VPPSLTDGVVCVTIRYRAATLVPFNEGDTAVHADWTLVGIAVLRLMEEIELRRNWWIMPTVLVSGYGCPNRTRCDLLLLLVLLQLISFGVVAIAVVCIKLFAQVLVVSSRCHRWCCCICTVVKQ
jgi:hypothetical protein